MGGKLSTASLNGTNTAKTAQIAKSYPYSHEDELWLTASTEILLKQRDANGKPSGTDPKHSNVTFLKELWQIAYESRISPKEFIKDVANRTSFLTRGKSDQAFLQEQRTEARNIYEKKLGEGLQNGYRVGFCKTSADKKVYAAIEAELNKYKAYEAQQAAIEVASTKLQVRIATEIVTRDLSTAAPRESGGPELSIGSIVETSLLNNEVDKATWIKTFITKLEADKNKSETKTGGKLQLDKDNLKPETLNRLWKIAEDNKLNPKEFISWLAFNTSLKPELIFNGKAPVNLFRYAEQIAKNGFLIKPQAAIVKNDKGQISNYINNQGVIDLNQMIEFFALAEKLDIKIEGQLTIVSKEIIDTNPINKVQITQITAIDDQGKLHIMRFEGTGGKPDLVAYKCQAGVPSIGYGTTRLPDGKTVKMGMTTTKEEALDWFQRDVNRRAARLTKALEGVPITQKLFNSLVSLSYNAGIEGVLNSKCLKELKNGNLDQAEIEFKGWCKYTDPNTKEKKISNGLVKRRSEEATAFRDAEQVELMLAYKAKLAKTLIASK